MIGDYLSFEMIDHLPSAKRKMSNDYEIAHRNMVGTKVKS